MTSPAVDLSTDSKLEDCKAGSSSAESSASAGYDTETRTTRRVLAGKGEVDAEELVDSSALLKLTDADDAKAADSATAQLQRALQDQGYLLLRGFLPRELVLRARRFILEDLQRAGFLREDSELMDGVAADADSTVSPRLLARQDLAHAAPVLSVLEHPSLAALMQRLQSTERVRTAQYKWLRAVARGQFTGTHCDSVYMGKGSPRLLTAWIPLGDVRARKPLSSIMLFDWLTVRRYRCKKARCLSALARTPLRSLPSCAKPMVRFLCFNALRNSSVLNSLTWIAQVARLWARMAWRAAG